MNRACLAGAAALVSALSTSCSPDTGTPSPGDVRDLKIQVGFADAAAIRLSDIAWFALELTLDGRPHDYTLSFNPSSRAFTWVEGPTQDLPPRGTAAVSLQAYGLDNAPLKVGSLFIGARSGPVDLESVEPGGTIELPVLVTKLGGFAPLGVSLHRARFLHSATAVRGRGVLIVGGAGSGTADSPTGLVDEIEWVDPFASRACSATSAGGSTGWCTGWGSVPPPRVHHVAVSLAAFTGAQCASLRNNVFIALGQTEAGTALADAYLFDPDKLARGADAFTELPSALGLAARIGATAHATRDCRVVIVGGHEAGDPTPLAQADVLRITPAGAERVGSVTVAPATSFAAAFRLDNNLDEVVVAGGRDATGVPVASAVSLDNSHMDIVVCDLSGQNGCNGGVASLLCARDYPVAGRLLGHQASAPALIVGTAAAGCSAGAVELFRSSDTTPYNAFVPVSAPPNVARWRGHTVTALGDGSAILVGGTDGPGAGTPTAAVERFTLEPEFSTTSTSAIGAFESQGPLGSPRGFHAASAMDELLFVVGGWDGSSTVANVEVFAPRL